MKIVEIETLIVRLVAVAAVSLIIMTAYKAGYKSGKDIVSNQSYILVVEKLTPDLSKKCQEDSNCMDLMNLDDLSKRGVTK